MDLKNWTAKRSGAGMTITGLDPKTGTQHRLVAIGEIKPVLEREPDGPICTAEELGGTVHRLF